jgi:hypothetical protein
MLKFEDFLHAKAREAILAFRDTIVPDIYVISFYFYNTGDGRELVLAVDYNTTERWKSCNPPDAEAKWNYAFWLQNQTCTIGEAPEEAARREEWIRSLDLWFTAEEFDQDIDRCCELTEKIQERFITLCSQVARRLHEEGLILQKFGRPVPIIIHELEYYPRLAEAAVQANPPGVADEFVAWVRSKVPASE